MSLTDWGWNSAWAECFLSFAKDGLAAARVAEANRGIYELESAAGRVRAELSGRLEYAAASAVDLPITGDWVAISPTDPALILAVLPRQSLFTRGMDDGSRQPLAANVDVAFLVCGLDHDWNSHRLDRYLVLSQEAGARPIILLNKRDLHAGAESIRLDAARRAPAILISATLDDVPAVIGAAVQSGETAALLGSSGVGKTTLVNALAGRAERATSEVREHDSRGRHTTTTRSLLRMPQGWLLIDMPGLRAVGLTGASQAVDDTFEDIAALARQCRFTDCTHAAEPGCAVRDAASPERLAHYRQLLREAAYQHRREDAAAARALKEQWKKIHIAFRKRPDKRG